MPRIARMVIPDQKTVYHVMSRSALDGYPLDDFEKDFLLDLIRQMSRVYFADILGFCIMGNHFHLAVQTCPEKDLLDDQVRKRYAEYYGREIADGQIPYFRRKWCDLSEFVRDIKQMFSRFYNKRHNRRGFFWGDRFKSVIVENGETLINCLAYIELNPIRAGLVERPEDYRWSSLGYHVQTNNKDNFLSLDFGLVEFGVLDAGERLRRYRRFVYEAGGITPPDKPRAGVIDAEILEAERKQDFNLNRTQRFRYRTRYFSDSGIIGTKEFVAANYQRFKDLFTCKHEKRPKAIQGLEGIYSMKRLPEA